MTKKRSAEIGTLLCVFRHSPSADFWDADARREMFPRQSPNLRLREMESTQSIGFRIACLRLITMRFRLWKKRQIFAVTLFLQFRHRDKTQRSRIDAVSFTGRRGAILENMTKMRIAFA